MSRLKASMCYCHIPWLVLMEDIFLCCYAELGDSCEQEFDFFFFPFFLCSLPYTSKLVKTLLYNFIRQEKPPPPGTHVFPPQSDGGGLLYGLASGVASKSFRIPIPYLHKLRLSRPKKFCSLGHHHYPFYWICETS